MPSCLSVAIIVFFVAMVILEEEVCLYCAQETAEYDWTGTHSPWWTCCVYIYDLHTKLRLVSCCYVSHFGSTADNSAISSAVFINNICSAAMANYYDIDVSTIAVSEWFDWWFAGTPTDASTIKQLFIHSNLLLAQLILAGSTLGCYIGPSCHTYWCTVLIGRMLHAY